MLAISNSVLSSSVTCCAALVLSLSARCYLMHLAPLSPQKPVIRSALNDACATLPLQPGLVLMKAQELAYTVVKL